MHLYIPAVRTAEQIEADRITKVAADHLIHLHEVTKHWTSRCVVVIKMVREMHPGLSLQEAKDWTQHHYPQLWAGS